MSRQDANAAFALSSFLQGTNAPYIDDLYARYVQDPASVDADWQAFFKSLKDAPADAKKNADGPSWGRDNWPPTPRDDLTSALVNAPDDEDILAPNEIAPFFILLAVAGNDTTRTAISRGMDLLAQNPDQRRVWQDDLDGVTTNAVEEIVRVASPVTFMRRTATKPVTVGDHEFAEGDKVVLLYGVANRDPRVFDDPERFDVARDPNPHVGFGGPGPHFCLGAHLARREVAVAFRQLFTRLPDIEVVGEAVPLEAMGIPLVGGIKRLPVRFTPTARRRRD